jgi:hypothetical protein
VEAVPVKQTQVVALVQEDLVADKPEIIQL